MNNIEIGNGKISSQSSSSSEQVSLNKAYIKSFDRLIKSDENTLNKPDPISNLSEVTE